MNPLTKVSITALAIVVLGLLALYVIGPWLPGLRPPYEIVEHGSAGPFRIGMDRASALAVVTALGAEAIEVDLRDDQKHPTRTPDGVDNFADAERIVVDFGALRLDFDGDKVVSIHLSSFGQVQQYAPLFKG